MPCSDAQGRNVEEQRIIGGVKTFFHRFLLDAAGRTLADSLYELVSGTYIATQAILSTYNTDTTVANQAHWQLSGSAWFCTQTSYMRYFSGMLASVTTLERDGVGTGMTDSLAYGYDGNGNRITEEEYDASRTLRLKVVYSWGDRQPTVLYMGEKAKYKGRYALKTRFNEWTASSSSQDNSAIRFFDLTGKVRGQFRANPHHPTRTP